jgi:hypothetical protein
MRGLNPPSPAAIILVWAIYFISYRQSACIGKALAKELKALGHKPHIHEWEIEGRENICGWMETRIDAPRCGPSHALSRLGRALRRAIRRSYATRRSTEITTPTETGVPLNRAGEHPGLRWLLKGTVLHLRCVKYLSVLGGHEFVAGVLSMGGMNGEL